MYRNRNRTYVSPVKKDFKMTDADFPEFGPSNKSDVQPETSKLDFKNCSKIDHSPAEVENSMTPGWLYGSYDKTNHNTRFANGECTKPPDEKFRSVQEITTELRDEWEKYIDQYIDLYGYDEYVKMFMPECLNYNEQECMNIDAEEDMGEEDGHIYEDDYGDVYDETYYDK
jgi:hypothetical protein